MSGAKRILELGNMLGNMLGNLLGNLLGNMVGNLLGYLMDKLMDKLQGVTLGGAVDIGSCNSTAVSNISIARNRFK